MKKIQDKLKECAETQSMSVESLQRLSNALHTTTADDTTAVEDAMMASEKTGTSILSKELAVAKELKGENTAASNPNPVVGKKARRSKHNKKSTIIPEKKEKKRPRFFVQF